MVLGVKGGKDGKAPLRNGRPFTHYLGKGTMTRPCGYINTIFGLEASHASLSEQSPLIKLTRGPMGGPGARGSLMRDH